MRRREEPSIQCYNTGHTESVQFFITSKIQKAYKKYEMMAHYQKKKKFTEIISI